MTEVRDWIQAMRRTKRMPWALVVEGPQGSGKTTFARFLRKSVERYQRVAYLSAYSIDDRDGFNTIEEFATIYDLLIIDEFEITGQIARIKNILTSESVEFNRKAVGRITAPVITNIVILSTNFDIGEDNRRFIKTTPLGAINELIGAL